MILDGNHKMLLSLCLQQTLIHPVRKFIKANESIARLKLCVKFLRDCERAGVFPNSIMSMKAPQMKSSDTINVNFDSCLKFTNFLRRKTLKFYIKCAREQLSEWYNRLFESRRELTQHRHLPLDVTTIGKRAFVCSTKFHNRRLNEKLNHLIRKQNPRNNMSNNKPDIPNKEHLVTDLTNTLSFEEKQLLSKGPKFALAPKIDKKLIDNTMTNFDHTAYQYRWSLNHSTTTNSFMSFPSSRELVAPPPNEEITAKLVRAKIQIAQVLTKASQNSIKFSNLTPEERKCLNTLKKKTNLILMPSDKGGEFCAMTTEMYASAVTKHLENRTTYRVMHNISAETVESRINECWKRICRERKVNNRAKTSFTTNGSELPKFRVLLKTHKEDPIASVRPIVGDKNGPSAKISWLLLRLTDYLVKEAAAHLEDSYELMRKISTLDDFSTWQGGYPFSLDVCQLYTSIPAPSAIEILHQKLCDQRFGYFGLKPEDVRELFYIVTGNTFFSYNQKVYKQVKGLPMGNRISGLLATLYMDRIEKSVLSSNTDVLLYARYVDDIFMITFSEQEAKQIFEKFNNADNNIKFEMELPKDSLNYEKCLCLLDFEVRISRLDGKKTFNFYKKSARKDIFVHYNSAIPNKQKKNIIENECRRIVSRCSYEEDAKSHLSNFKNTLINMAYPNSYIKDKNIEYYKHSKIPKSQRSKLFFRIPFITEKINKEIKKILSSEGLPFCLAQKTKTMTQELQKKDFLKSKCNKKNCRLHNEMCMKKKCVYNISCEKCKEFYIGSTERRFHHRHEEHHKDADSAVHEHQAKCHGKFSCKILDFAENKTLLRLKEGSWQRKLKPSLNKKDEIGLLNSFII